MRRIMILAAVLLALAACGGGSDDAAPPTTEATTTTTEPELDRDTLVAVATCVTEMRSVGLALMTLGSRAGEDAMDACEDAQTQLDVDNGGVVGPTPANQISVLLAERNFEVSLLAVKAASKTLTGDDAGKLDATYQEWAGKVSELTGT